MEQKERQSGVWAHPLTLLLLGTLLTSAIVPYLSTKITHNRILQEERIRTARKIFDDSELTEKQLNMIRTKLESFYKDASEEPKRRRAEQEELRKEMNIAYAQFDAHSWYWCSSASFESGYLELDGSRRTKIRELCSSYSKSLKGSISAIDPAWGQFVSGSVGRSEFNSALLTDLHKNLDTLASERAQLVGQLIVLVTSN